MWDFLSWEVVIDTLASKGIDKGFVDEYCFPSKLYY